MVALNSNQPLTPVSVEDPERSRRERSEDPDPQHPKPQEHQTRHKTLTEKQLRANRRNARKSTGPRTPEGKERISLNALTHGVFAKSLFLPGDDAQAFQDFREGLIDSIRPQNALEMMLVDQIFAAQWKSGRVLRAEQMAHELERKELRKMSERFLKRMRRKYRISSAEELERELAHSDYPRPRDRVAFYRTSEREISMPEPGPTEFTAELTTLSAVCKRAPQPMERLEQYQHRLHNQFHRSLRDLLALRAQAQKQSWHTLPASPFAASTPLHKWPPDDPTKAQTPPPAPTPPAPTPPAAPPPEPPPPPQPQPPLVPQSENRENKPISPESAASQAPATTCANVPSPSQAPQAPIAPASASAGAPNRVPPDPGGPS